MTINSSRIVFFTAALAFAFMGCPPGGGGNTGGGTGTTTGGGTGTTTGGGTGTTTGGGTGTTTGGGTGTTTGGGTGTTTGGGTGVTCTEITLKDFAFNQNDVQNQYVSFAGGVDPNLGAADPDDSVLEFYGNFAANTFNLASNTEKNYSSCQHCLLVYQDNTKVFFQKSGSLLVGTSDAGTLLNGNLSATLADVTLIEVTINDTTFVSTPVDGGACLHLAAATLNVIRVPPPAGWVCGEQYYGDGTCQCGCGVQDSDCAGTTDATECAACGCPTEATDAGAVPSYCNPADTKACLPVPTGWVCPSNYFSDNSCDCGCGLVDTDCADAGIGACEWCNDEGSCTLAFNDAGVAPGTPAADGGVLPRGCGYIEPTNNAVCQPLPVVDAGTVDSGTPEVDAGTVDSGTPEVDAGTVDSGTPEVDGGTDAGTP